MHVHQLLVHGVADHLVDVHQLHSVSISINPYQQRHSASLSVTQRHSAAAALTVASGKRWKVWCTQSGELYNLEMM